MKNNNFEIKKKIVKAGESKIFDMWKEFVPTLTEEEFLENLKWVCEDKCENGDGTGRLTREIGLTKSGIVKITRSLGSIVTFYRNDTGELWYGDFFTVPCTEKYIKNAEKAIEMGYADKNEIRVQIKFGISARDRV